MRVFGVQSRSFSSNNKTDKDAFLEREKAHFNSLSDKEKQYYQALRLSLIKTVEESWKDKSNWWNKVETMSQNEIETLPDEYIRKFGSFIIKTSEMQKESHTEINKDLDFYSQVKNLNKVKTNEELALEEAAK